MSLLADRITALGTENAFKVGADIAKCEARGMDVIKFNLGEPDFDTPAPVNEMAVEHIRGGNSHYCDPAGILPFRQAIAKHLSETRGIDADPAKVVVTPGAKPPIGYSIQTYVNPGDEVIYPSPGFPIYESWVNYVGAVPKPLHLSEDRDFAFGPEDLERLITDKTKLIILCSPSNPTGGVLGKDVIPGIADVIRAKCGPEVRVYTDEVYEHILFDGEEHCSIASEPGMLERTILVSGHSKGFAMTGWRLGFALLPTAEEAAVFKQLNINLVSCVPPFVQEAGREAYENPETAVAVAKMIDAFQRRRDVVVAGLNAIEGVTCRNPKGAFYVFPNIGGVCERLGVVSSWEAMPPEQRKKTSPAGMFQMFLLYSYGVATMDRKSFGAIGSEGQHFLRLSIANSQEQLKAGVARMAQAADDADGFQEFLEREKLWG